jgi:hypothetical protein
MRHDQLPAGRIILLSFEVIRKTGSQKPVLGLKENRDQPILMERNH